MSDGARIGNILQQKRHTQRITKSELANRLGLSEKTIVDIELGNVKGRCTEVFAMALELKVDIGAFVDEETRPIWELAVGLRDVCSQ